MGTGLSRGRPPGARDRHGRAVHALAPARRSHAWRAFCHGFASVISQRMLERDIAATELAAAISMSPQSIFAWCRGRSVPSVPTLFAIATALGCTVADLLPEEIGFHQ